MGGSRPFGSGQIRSAAPCVLTPFLLQVQRAMRSFRSMRSSLLLGALMSLLVSASNDSSTTPQLRGQSSVVTPGRENHNNGTAKADSICCPWPFQCNGCASVGHTIGERARYCRNQHVLCIACDCDCCAMYGGRG